MVQRPVMVQPIARSQTGKILRPKAPFGGLGTAEKPGCGPMVGPLPSCPSRCVSMKLRSAILFGCLLVVPLVAMFSHKVPPGVREAFRGRLWRPVVDRITGGSSTAPDTEAGPAEVWPSTTGSQAAVPQPTAAVQAGAEVPRSATAAAGRVDVPPPLPTVTLRSTPVDQPSRTSLDERLKRLGAVGLQVKPPEDDLGVHVASCRVPVDADGQLQRLFQANGPTPEASLGRLVDQIERWRSRLSSRPVESPPPRGPGEPAAAASGRFR